MGPPWTFLLLLLLLPGPSYQDPQLAMVAPRRVALGVPAGVLLQATGPVAGALVAQAQGATDGTGLCSAEVPFSLEPHNDFSQLLHIQVSLEQAARCGLVDKGGGRALLLEARSPQLPPPGSQRLQVTWGGPRGHLFVQTDKPIYAPQQTVRFRVFSLDLDLQPSLSPILVTILDGQGVPVRQKQQVPVNAVLSDHLTLPDVARPGTWQIQAQLIHSPETVGNISFAVRKYVLPTFDVKIVPEQKFILVTDPDPPDLHVELHVKYLHGAPVGAGLARLRVGLGAVGTPGRFLRPLEQQAPVTSGRAVLTVSPREVARALGRPLPELAGARLRLAAAVLETRGGELVQQESMAVKLVASRWSLELAETPRVFVPAAPFLLLVQVKEADGAPAPHVPVRVRVLVQGAGGPLELPPPGEGAEVPRTDATGTLVFPVNVPAGATTLNLTVEAGAAGPPARAALAAAAVAGPLALALEAPPLPLPPGQLLPLRMRRSGGGAEPDGPTHLLVVARGRLLRALRAPPGAVTETQVPLPPALAPACRLVAFFRAGGRLVAAGLRLRLAPPCPGQVAVQRAVRGGELLPQSTVELTVTVTEPGPVTVALGATDGAVLALDGGRQRLSQDKVAVALGALDQGCGPGGAPDAWGVFEAAGLALAVGGVQRTPEPPACPPNPARRRRSLELQKLLEEEEERAGPSGGRCCRDGAVALPLRRSCAARARRVPREDGCRAAFERCCARARHWRRRHAARGAGLARVLDMMPDEELLEDDLPTRSFFPESWLWRSLRVNGSERLSVPLPDSITTWEIQAIAIIPGYGVCVAAPLRLQVTQDLHVGLRLPYSARPREQLQPRALLHSRLPQDVNVTVSLSVAAGVCAALAEGPQHLEVPAGAVVAMPFTLVALGPGDIPITITARGPWGFGDRITRILHVKAEGELHLEETSYVLDTDGQRGWSLQIPGDIPADVVPDGDFSMSVRVSGRVLGATLEAALGAGAAGVLLRAPRGCGEQTLMVLAPAAAALRYLDHSRAWARLPPGCRQRGLRALQQGYERIQSFRKDDGSYAGWRHRPSSTWLSALVLRVLSGLRRWQQVDEAGLRATTRWLLRQQGPSGAFRDPQPIIHRRMQGGMAGAEAAVALTAFVAVALHQARDVHGPEHTEQQQLLDAALARAAGFLRGRMEMAGPFAAAIGTYALALSDTPGSPEPLLRLARSAHNGSAQFWPAGGAAETVEATGYGLLALLRLNDVAGALRAARWLREQSNYGGGFHSTQDTVVALEALSELWLHSPQLEELGLDVTFAWPRGPGRHSAAGRTQVTLRKGLEHVERKLEVPLGSPVTVQVKGEGQGTLTVQRQYRVMSPANGTCGELGLEVSLSGPINYEQEDYEDYEDYEEGAGPGEGAGLEEGVEPRRRRQALASPELRSRQAAMHVCIWRQAGTPLAGMAVAEVALLSGFRPHRDDLDKLRDVVDRYISHYELDGGQLVLYFDEVPPQRDCVTFGVTQEVAVGLLQPAAATIFDYYEPERRCTVFYSAPRRSSFVATLCSPGVCECAEGACPRAQRPLAKELTAAKRLHFACNSPRVDYALVVEVQGEGQFGAFVGAETKIVEVLQSGPWEAAVGQQRRFLVRGGCRLRLRPQRRYLLMGRSGPTRDPHGRPQTLLGPDSWVEEVPSASRCGATLLRGVCAELQSFLEDFARHGCQV